ncbi:MAG: ATP-binding protein [Deltaproteobacteria bacterium]|nr:ATP-binding protein [Deltaproteobacteria bacterium]
MRLRRKRIFLPNTIGTCDPVKNMEANERFVVRKCGIYLKRLLHRYPFVDTEWIAFLHWIVGSKIEEVARYLTTQMKDGEVKDFEEELSECQLDQDEYPETIIRMLRRLPSRQPAKLLRFILRLLTERIAELSCRRRSDIEKNMTCIKKMFNLTEQESQFCLFHFIMNDWKHPEGFFDDHLQCKKFSGRRHVTAALQITVKELHDILGGTLAKIGMFDSGQWGEGIEDEFIDLFRNPSTRAISKKFFGRLPRKSLPLKYHMVSREQTEYVLTLLRRKSKGSTHILFYGAPGTGKTAYAQGIAKELGLPAYETVRGDEGNTSSKRRAGILACLNMTNTGSGSLILVDEADNLLGTRFSWFFQGETHDKGWLNYLLEIPGARMIWITNRIERIEESVLRRFAFSLNFKPFNQRQRTTLWNSVLRRNRVKRLFTQSEIEELAKHYKVNAGAIDLAVKKAVESGQMRKNEFHKAVALALDSHRILLNNGEKPRDKDRIEKNYSLAGLNIEGDLQETMGQLEKFDQYLRKTQETEILNMNLLFYGPPGTGKSELSRYVAERLDRASICKRASDFLDPFVGVTEQKIKEAFQEAEAEEAVLVVDEADSMLFARERAVRSWEISHTNEFLTQMERFRGILICTTNRLKDLDEASIRRFNQKIEFKYLTPEGNLIFYERLLLPLIQAPVDEQSRGILMATPSLSPGDFKVVRDKFSFYPPEEVSHQLLIRALREEVEARNLHGGNKEIGF